MSGAHMPLSSDQQWCSVHYIYTSLFIVSSSGTRAKVGLLFRNTAFKSDGTGANDRYGGHLMIRAAKVTGRRNENSLKNRANWER